MPLSLPTSRSFVYVSVRKLAAKGVLLPDLHKRISPRNGVAETKQKTALPEVERERGGGKKARRKRGREKWFDSESRWKMSVATLILFQNNPERFILNRSSFIAVSGPTLPPPSPRPFFCVVKQGRRRAKTLLTSVRLRKIM